jgi:hypothetical protein
MRKIILITLLCFFIVGGLTKTAEAAIKVVAEGSGDEYPHYLDMRVTPETKDQIVMVSLEDLADGLNWSVSWYPSTADIYVKGNGRRIQMKIDSPQAVLDSIPVNMPVSPKLTDGNIMIPLTFVSESLGYYIESSKIWNNLDQIYITPYRLISDIELAQSSEVNFCQSVDRYGFITWKLKKDGKTPGGIGLGSSIWDVLQVYGVPRSPQRTLNYPGDWTGTLIYWGTFIPNSEMGTFYEFTFTQGALVDLTISF